ncbi:Hvo_1808 family surface protein [Natrinema sp. HArc-T2]|uniref:Hvo_1808 family surface protein n=1 Tax=Natrinema sp. HArc-T2 TaxID=3242701 RepID=UPI00359ECFBA
MPSTRPRTSVVLLVLVLAGALVTSGLAGPVLAASATAASDGTTAASADRAELTPRLNSATTTNAAITPPDDRPANPSTEDTVGYVEGYWYDDELPVDDQSDAVVDDDDLEPVVYRAMARVERIRNLTFKDEVAVDVVSRETYQQTNDDRFENYTTAERLEQNVGYEALFTVDRDTTAVNATKTVYGGAVKGYYDPETDEIVIVSENPETPELDELTLGHELVHALQDQRFNLSELTDSTQDGSLATKGVVEGDASWVEREYESRCSVEWDCLTPRSQGAGQFDVNWGIYFAIYQPYSDGPDYIDHLRQQGDGWSAVNAAYDEPPATTAAVIHPGSEREPETVAIPDRSSDGWRQLTVDGVVANDTIGEAGMVAMFAADAMNQDQPSVLDATDLDVLGGGRGFNYDHAVTDGWAGDTLVIYTTDEIDNESDPAAAAGRAGYVWRTEWQSTEDTGEFLEGYRELLENHGAEPVVARQNTFVIDDGGYAGAYYIERNGTTATVVRAPSVAALSNVDAGAAPDATPGFGVTAAVGAIAVTLFGTGAWLAVGRKR